MKIEWKLFLAKICEFETGYYVEGLKDNYYVFWYELNDKKYSNFDITQVEEVARYHSAEIISLIDLVYNNDYTFPLFESHGKALFNEEDILSSLKAIKSLYLPYNIYVDKIKSDYKQPLGPKRRRGRPSKIRYEDDVKSSNLKKIYYDKGSSIMKVDFNSGWTYTYTAVPFRKYFNLRRAKSKGKYFHRNIRFSYPYKRID
jgi:hypothetical protein